jgi:hypothetical protein
LAYKAIIKAFCLLKLAYFHAFMTSNDHFHTFFFAHKTESAHFLPRFFSKKALDVSTFGASNYGIAGSVAKYATVLLGAAYPKTVVFRFLVTHFFVAQFHLAQFLDPV